MDVLSDVLDTLRLQSASLFRAKFRVPWAIAVAAEEEVAPCYIVSSGSCSIEVEGSEAPVRLSGRDLILLPHGNAHVLHAEQGTEPVPLEEILSKYSGADTHREIQYGGSGALTVLIVGSFHLEHRPANLLFPDSQAIVHIHADAAGAGTWLDMLAELICAEATGDRLGAEMAVSRLMDLLFLQLVRARIAASMASENDRGGSFLRALADPELSKALELIHQHPEYSWTVVELASQIGMSRTAFATHFTQVAGVPPLTYVRQWRMLQASDQLRRGEATLAEIAEQVGYDSEAAFAKAFKRETGLTPGAYRQRWRRRLFRP